MPQPLLVMRFSHTLPYSDLHGDRNRGLFYTVESKKELKNRQTNWLNSQRQSELVTGIHVFTGP